MPPLPLLTTNVFELQFTALNDGSSWYRWNMRIACLCRHSFQSEHAHKYNFLHASTFGIVDFFRLLSCVYFRLGTWLTLCFGTFHCGRSFLGLTVMDTWYDRLLEMPLRGWFKASVRTSGWSLVELLPRLRSYISVTGNYISKLELRAIRHWEPYFCAKA